MSEAVLHNVTCYYGATPHGDCLPVVLGVDERNVIRKIDDSFVFYGTDILSDVVDECLLSELPKPTYPFSNIFPTIERAHLSAVAYYEAMRDEAEYGLSELRTAKQARIEAAAESQP